MTNRRVRSGAVLLEVLVAMAIFATASAVTLARASEARHAVAVARTAEARLANASAFLDRVALWPRDDLDRHLGAHPQGEWNLDITHPAPALYVVALLDCDSRRTLFNTVLYRSVPHVQAQ